MDPAFSEHHSALSSVLTKRAFAAIPNLNCIGPARSFVQAVEVPLQEAVACGHDFV